MEFFCWSCFWHGRSAPQTCGTPYCPVCKSEDIEEMERNEIETLLLELEYVG